MKRILLTTAFIGALGACSPAIATEPNENYVCSPSIFGCYTEYVGERSEKMALSYLKDSKEATAWIAETYADVETAHYNPRRAEIVIQLVENGNRLNIPKREIFAHFNQEELFAKTIIIMNNKMTTVLASGHNGSIDNRFGRARYQALSSIAISSTHLDKPSSEAVESARDAWAPVRHDVWGNTTITFN